MGRGHVIADATVHVLNLLGTFVCASEASRSSQWGEGPRMILITP